MTALEYTALRSTGRAAEAEVHGVIRGGFVLNGMFYAHAGSRGIIKVPLSVVLCLRFV